MHVLLQQHGVHCSKDSTTDVICKLLKKYNITDRPSRFALNERDVLSGKKIAVIVFCTYYTFKQFSKLILWKLILTAGCFA